jgi:hypothetical protein
MPTFDECIEKAKKAVDEWGEHILTVIINSAHGTIEITWTPQGYRYTEIEE